MLGVAACAESKEAWRNVSTDTKHAFGGLGKSCPEALPGRASGADAPDGALSCFQKAVGSEKPELLLRIVCHGRSAASCKHTAAAERDVTAGLKELAKHSWTDVLGSWPETPGKVVVYAIDNREREGLVSTVTVCKIADTPATDADGGKSEEVGWAVCDVDELARDAAKKKIAS